MKRSRTHAPPHRRCIGCKVSVAKAELLRFVFESGALRWDREGTRPGRGAYLHQECVGNKAVASPKVWEHGLRLKSDQGGGGILTMAMVRQVLSEVTTACR